MENNTKITPVSIIILIILVAGITFMATKYGFEQKYKDSLAAENTGSDLSKIKLNPVSPNEHLLGNYADAKIFIVEFSDLECPYCKQFHPIVHQIVDESKGKVAWVYRQFPLDKPNAQGNILHSKGGPEARGAECMTELGGNDAFWKYTDKIFDITPSNNGLDLSVLPSIAASFGVDKNKFNDCIITDEIKAKVEAQYQDGVTAGVTGTPTSYVVDTSGKIIDMVGGFKPYKDLKEQIDQDLKK